MERDGPQNYPAGDPRADPNNWNFMGQYTGPAIEGWSQQAYEYVPVASGPPAQPAYDPLSSGNPGTPAPETYVWADGSTWTQGDPMGTGTATPATIMEPPPPLPATIVTNPGSGAGSGGMSGAAPQPLGDVALGGPIGTNVSGGTIGYGSGQSDFITPMTTIYDAMLASGGGAALGAAPVVDPATGQLVDPVTGYPADPGYTTGYDAGYGYGSGQEYATDPMTGLPVFPGDGFGSEPQTSPYGFDPFLWAGVKNPMPAPSAMRGQIMQAGGFAGPAWAPAPPPQPPGPMAYVRSRLGMQEPGHTLEMKPPVPGFRFDGTPRSEPREESQNFVPADQAGMLPPLPPTFPRRGY